MKKPSKEPVPPWLILLFVVFVFMVCLTSCKSQQFITQEQSKETVITIRDTIIINQADSSMAMFKIKYDSIAGIQLQPIASIQGRSMLVPKVKIEGDVLTVEAFKQIETNRIIWCEINTRTREIITKIVEVNVLKLWQKILIWAGALTLIAAFGYLLFLFGKKYARFGF